MAQSFLPARNLATSRADAAAADRFRRWSLAYLRHAPLALCIRELNRLMAMAAVEERRRLRRPVLDVGCGDGFWWTQREGGAEGVYGIDISPGEVRRAQERIRAALVDVARERPFADVSFPQIIGNCSLEHVRDIDAALRHLRAAATPDACFLLFVPSADWALRGVTQEFLLRRLPRVAMAVSGALNGFFQHWHLYSVPVWRSVLERTGWRVREAVGVGNARAEFLFRLLLPLSFPEFLFKSAFGFYPSRLLRLLPDAALSPLCALLRWALPRALVEVDSREACEYLIVAEPA